jgi:hypothetical protein
MAVIDKGLPEMPSPTEEELASWREWVSSRPPAVKALCEKLPPWHYYDMPKTGQIVTVEAYSENGTVRVNVVGDQISIPAIVSFDVFGVPPDDLVRRT